MTFINPVFCAIDTNNLPDAMKLAESIKPFVGGYKIGLEFYLANGSAGYQAIAGLGLPIFLDLKLHDIPNTVQGALNSLLPLSPQFITVHTSGGPAMLQAAAKVVKSAANPPKILGVTVLTSLDQEDLAAVGQTTNPAEQVEKLARLAKNCGLDGVICAPSEIENLRKICGPDFILMVPGIRPDWASAGDQKRVLTPKEAIVFGATHLVIGRPITAAPTPALAAERILSELKLETEAA